MGENEPNVRACEYYRRWRARTHRSSLTRGARFARAAATRAAAAKTGFPLLANFLYSASVALASSTEELAALNV